MAANVVGATVKYCYHCQKETLHKAFQRNGLLAWICQVHNRIKRTV